MATLHVEQDQLVLSLTRGEKLEGIHGDLRVALSSVSGVEVLDDAHQAADIIGVKAGTRIPGVIEVGTISASDKTIFAAVHRDTPRGVRVRLHDAAHDEWIVGCADPESVAAAVAAHGPAGPAAS